MALSTILGSHQHDPVRILTRDVTSVRLLTKPLGQEFMSPIFIAGMQLAGYYFCQDEIFGWDVLMGS